MHATLIGPGPALTRQVVTDPRALNELGPAWAALLRRSASNEPMLSPTWLMTWWAVYGEGTGRQLRTVLFYEDDRLVGLAPLARRTYRYRLRLPFRRLEPLGADVDEQDGVCSDYLNVIAERGAERRVCASLAAALPATSALRAPRERMAGQRGPGAGDVRTECEPRPKGYAGRAASV